MFTKNQAKLIRSLQDKKSRTETGLFLVEGEKNVLELLNSDFVIDLLLITDGFLEKHGGLVKGKIASYEIVSESDLEKNGTLGTNDSALAVVRQKQDIPLEMKNDELIIALDKVQDPGNLGTIIRIADWYKIRNIVASKDTVDFYNPKVISASKGSFARVDVSYVDLRDYLSKANMPILGAYLKGENIHKIDFPKGGILLVGNESNGINDDLGEFVTKKITIPSYGKMESLNVAMATAIIVDNWKRNLK
jgi:TrmH family RNA methyltransferase